MFASITAREGRLCGGCAGLPPLSSQPHNLTTYLKEEGKRRQGQQQRQPGGNAYPKHSKVVVRVVRS